MKKSIITIFLAFFIYFGCINPVFAAKPVDVKTSKDGNNYTVTYVLSNDEIYGVSSSITYDPNAVELKGCNGSDGVDFLSYSSGNEVTFVADSILPIEERDVVTCNFTVKADNTIITVKDINTSNGEELTKQQEQLEIALNIPNTLSGKNILFIVIALIMFSLGGYFIYKGNKNTVSLFLICLLAIPFNTMAKDTYTNDDLDTVRNIIVKAVPLDISKHGEYDLDSDNAITVNDLYLIKKEMNKPKIAIETTTKGSAQYYTEVKANITIDSLTGLSKIKYCFDKEKCTPNKEYSKTDKNTFSLDFDDNKDAQMLCVKVTNLVNLSKTTCSNTFLVDSKQPTIKFKKESVTVTDESTYNTKNNVDEVTYGPGGGSYSCTSATAVGTHTIKCTATGNNGLKTEKTYTLVINQKNWKVLFVGNSKTYVNDIPNTFDSIATSNGYKVTTTAVTEGGKTLAWHASNSVSSLQAVSNYDYLVLQEQYDALVDSSPNGYYNGAKAVYDLVKPNNSGIKPVVRALWTHGVQDGDNYYFSNEGFSNAVSNSEYVADKLNAIIVYDGKAFKSIDTNHHSIILLSDTTGHQTEAGAYLSAACIYKKIFNKSPVGTTYRGNLSESVANTLLSTANSVG